jgi:hypothetical protein
MIPRPVPISHPETSSATKTRCDAEKKAAMQKKKATKPTVKSVG